MVDRTLRKARRSHIDTVTSSDDPKLFWRYVKSQCKNNTGIKTLKVNNIDIISDQAKAETLAEQLSSVFNKDKSTHFIT